MKITVSQSKLFVSVLMALAIAGCSTAGKLGGSSDSVSNEPPPATDEPLDASDEAGVAQVIPPEVKSGKLDQKYHPLAAAVRKGNAKGIVDEASKILGTNPHDLVALNALALFHFRAGRVGAAKHFLNRAFEKNQPTAALHNNLGVILLEEGDQPSAIANFKKALRLDDGHAETLGNLGSLYVRGGDYNRALPLLEQSYRANSNQPSVAVNYAIALRGAGKVDDARRIYENLIKKNSRDIPAHLNLAALLIEHLNKPKDGLALVYKVKFLETERKDVLDRANALEKKAKAAIQ